MAVLQGALEARVNGAPSSGITHITAVIGPHWMVSVLHESAAFARSMSAALPARRREQKSPSTSHALRCAVVVRITGDACVRAAKAVRHDWKSQYRRCNMRPFIDIRRTKIFPPPRMGQHSPYVLPCRVVVVCWFKRSVPDTAGLPRSWLVHSTAIPQNTPAKMIYRRHLLAADQIRPASPHLPFQVVLASSIISVYDSSVSVLFCSWSVVLSGVILRIRILNGRGGRLSTTTEARYCEVVLPHGDVFSVTSHHYAVFSEPAGGLPTIPVPPLRWFPPVPARRK